MACCEKCWNDSYSPGTDHSERYSALVQSRLCSPEEQAGNFAGVCESCGRKAVHQYALVCMNCGVAAVTGHGQ